MRINSLAIHNYRCIGEIKLDNLSPITILVGRNNTGKSALLEAVALVCTGKSGWHDSLGDDLITPIIKRRGGWKYADMMIKIGEQYAEINAVGENATGTVQITRNLDDLHDSVSDRAISGVDNYIDQIASQEMRRLETRLERYSDKKSNERELMMRQARLQKEADAVKQNIWKQIRAYLGYYDEHDTVEYALVLGEKSKEIFTRISRISRMGVVVGTSIRGEEIIRSALQGKSETIFLLSPSIQYLKTLQRRLAKSGDLLNLIDMLRKRIGYFTDIREVDNDFLVFLKGLARPVPLGAMGDGFRAKLAILSAIATVGRGVALMEEPETRLHPGFMSSVVNQIVETSTEGDLQFIISTHNLDLLELLLEAHTELTNVVRMYRTEEDSGIDYEVLAGKEAQEELNELKMDLRGV